MFLEPAGGPIWCDQTIQLLSLGRQIEMQGGVPSHDFDHLTDQEIVRVRRGLRRGVSCGNVVQPNLWPDTPPRGHLGDDCLVPLAFWLGNIGKNRMPRGSS